MLLALIYIFATAKPISVRRLSALFALSLMLGVPGLAILRVQDVRGDALLIATSLTLLVWSIPLLQAVCDTVRRGSLSLKALRSASTFVRWTYGFVIAASPIALILLIPSAPHHLHLADLAKGSLIIGILAVVLQIGLLVALPTKNVY